MNGVLLVAAAVVGVLIALLIAADLASDALDQPRQGVQEEREREAWVALLRRKPGRLVRDDGGETL